MLTRSDDLLRQHFWPAFHSRHEDLPWIPSGVPGKSAKPLRFLPGNTGFVELLRMEPGVVMPIHHHTGAIHAFDLQGKRRLCTARSSAPGTMCTNRRATQTGGKWWATKRSLPGWS